MINTCGEGKKAIKKIYHYMGQFGGSESADPSASSGRSSSLSWGTPQADISHPGRAGNESEEVWEGMDM